MTVRDKLLEEIEEIARRNKALSNPFRVLVLAAIKSRGTASWYELKEIVERVVGRVNPNTLAFHINKLVEAGFVVRAGPERSPRYEAREVPDDIAKISDKLKTLYRGR